MDQKKKIINAKKFCVVEFLQLPYRDIKKFVIVPRYWVTNQKSPGLTVAYPRESPAKTQNRCVRNERPKGDWKKYLARIKFENDNYATANQWIVQNANESTNNGIMDRENVGNQSATTIKRKAHSTCHNAKLNAKPPVKGPLLGNDRNTRTESPRPSSSSSWAITRENLEMARATISAIEKLASFNNSLENLGRENLPLTHGNNLSRGQEMVRRCPIKVRDSSQRNARNTTAVQSTSLNHCHQPVENQNEELSTLSEGISHNHCSHQEPVPKRSIKKNSNDQSTQTMTPVTQTPTHLMKQQSPILKSTPESPFLIINGNHIRQGLRGGERPEKPIEVNGIGQRADPQDVTETQKQHSPAREDNLPQNSDQSKLVTTGPPELKFVCNDNQHQVINENALLAMQNLSNVAHQLSQIIKHSHSQWPPVYKASIQNDLPVNNIFFFGSTGAGSDQKVPCPSFTKNTSYIEQSIPSAVQYPLNSVAHTFCSSECSQGKRYSSFIPSDPFQGIRNNDPLISGLAGGSSISRQMVDPINGMNSTGQSRHDESYEPPKKKSHQEYPVVLPPKTKSMRLTMTLKHQKASPGVIEVLPRSQVYIDSRKFGHCKYEATSYSRLARMLLVEIFSEHALRECTLSGGKKSRYRVSHERSGLDEHAKNVLLTFVEEYGRQKGWGVYNERSVLKSLSNMLLEIRGKSY